MNNAPCSTASERRILIVDDNAAIHEDFRKILSGVRRDEQFDDASSGLFGETDSIRLSVAFELDSATQGQEGLEKIKASCLAGNPFSMAFVDMRMPPGWDGVETIQQMWKVDPCLQIVLCTAYSDYSWAEIVAKLGYNDRILILKKPFDHTEVLQLALALTEKQKVARAAAVEMAELNDLVAQRTSEVANRDALLRQKQKLEAIGSLAGGIAHEFNNLLQAIQGYTAFAMEGLASGEQPYQDLQQVLVAAGRAANVTSQLLKFSRSGSTSRQVLSPIDLVNEAVAMMKPLLGEHIEFQHRVSPEPLELLVDKSMIGQALMNLCINARDAMPSGGTLTLSVECLTEEGRSGIASLCDLPPGPYVTIAVSDTGCGMSEELQERIFDPFFTTKSAGQGTGLGLATVHDIVRNHDGVIDVESCGGAGSTFRIYLPIAKTSPPPQPQQSMQPTRGGSELILLAEDEPIVRRIAQRILVKAGYRTITAVDGADAIKKFKKHRDEIDLLLLDVVMPMLSGQETYAEIVSNWQDMPAILCTAYDPSVVCVGSQPSRELPIVSKPFNRDELLRVVRAELDAAATPLTDAAVLVTGGHLS